MAATRCASSKAGSVVRWKLPSSGSAVASSPYSLDRPVVPLAMFVMLLAAKIVGFRQIRRGHHVPAGAAAADMVERGEFAGDVVGLVVARRRSRDDADMF